ncbi:DUF6691 family protein [Sulfuriferula nivalis]|uniref:Transporter n=1 Tax=Sulfuriferula nivalis TaxID=2675298 RepID=A0A809REQ3_9PROT|nr:DUF6691 family protein [Sulfuriferula nivalis]BBP00269.1 transporter [Sulfuriferula nivalis]
MNQFIYLVLGTIFGMLLSLAGATTFDFYAELFQFKNMQLSRVIASAVVVGMVGIFLMKRLKARAIMTGDEIHFDIKKPPKNWVWGSLLFGSGWALTGSCPGSAPAMLGEGKLIIIPVLLGVIAGTYLYALIQSASDKCVK